MMQFKDIKPEQKIYFLMEDEDDEAEFAEETEDQDVMSIGIFEGVVKEVEAGLIFIHGERNEDGSFDESSEMFLFNDEVFKTTGQAVEYLTKVFANPDDE